jgi:hypothetical protein
MNESRTRLGPPARPKILPARPKILPARPNLYQLDPTCMTCDVLYRDNKEIRMGVAAGGLLCQTLKCRFILHGNSLLLAVRSVFSFAFRALC